MPESAWLPIVRNKSIAMMMDMIKGDLAALNIKHDVFFSERSLIETGNNKVTETIDFLRSKGDIYEGRCRRRRASRSTITRIGSRRCSAPPPMATTSIVR